LHYSLSTRPLGLSGTTPKVPKALVVSSSLRPKLNLAMAEVSHDIILVASPDVEMVLELDSVADWSL